MLFRAQMAIILAKKKEFTMAARVEPSNFYWHNCPAELIKNKPVTPGEKYTTQFPTNVALIRIAVTAIFTAYVVGKVMGLTMWAWPVVIVGASFSVYTAVKHLFMPDPLVAAMHTIAGGKDQYNSLPVINVTPNEKLWKTLDTIQWNDLVHPLSRATTSDGRKVLIVKGCDFVQQGAFFGVAGARVNIRTVTTFVEKLGPNDVPRVISNLDERFEAALMALPVNAKCLENSCDKLLHDSGNSAGRTRAEMCSSITSDMMNEFIYQREGNKVVSEPKVD
jgi:hypothetical protein